jgi:hypothetical protein
MFFDRVSPNKKKLSHSFADLILINTIIPLQFAFKQGKVSCILLLNEVTSEKNSIEKFASFGIKSDSL